MNDNSSIETTVGQLNFFKWAIDNLIIDYIKDNYKDIEEDMNISFKSMKKEKNNMNIRKKRQIKRREKLTMKKEGVVDPFVIHL